MAPRLFDLFFVREPRFDCALIGWNRAPLAGLLKLEPDLCFSLGRFRRRTSMLSSSKGYWLRFSRLTSSLELRLER